MTPAAMPATAMVVVITAAIPKSLVKPPYVLKFTAISYIKTSQ